MSDAIAKMKEVAREGWATFTPFEALTGTVAPMLVRFAAVSAGQRVLDVGCGTGVVALAAARRGAVVTGADLTPALLANARRNAELAGLGIDFQEADVEALPFDDASFDVVLSQFGHMFGPRPAIATGEMLRVLKPAGTIAFSTWPPELYTGRMFALVGRYLPPLPEGARSPVEWGDPAVVRERLGAAVSDLRFDRACLQFPALSPAHARMFMESNAAPVLRVVETLAADTARLANFRRDFEELASQYFHDNFVRQDFLMSRATKN